ncbi:MAG: RNB domain-containing ribonuclease [Cyclobacteriaceae bacterium]
MSKKTFKKIKEKKNKREKSSVYSSILALLEEMVGKAYSTKQITRKLGIKKKSLITDLYHILDQLEEEGKIQQLGNGTYRSAKESASITGRVDHVNPRFAYVIVDGEEKDIYVKSRDMGSAIHGDIVELNIFSSRKGASPEGKVTNVVKRNRNRFVGRIEVSPNYSFIVPDFKKIYHDFFVYAENVNGAQTNDKVVFEVTKWSTPDRNPEAKVIEILGKTGENEAEIHSIMAEFDLPFRFESTVLNESENIKDEISSDEIKKRKDFRKVLTFTIDPEDAKDFDDAISFRELENGHYEIGVHIADVTHYVQPGTLLEKDAFDRATSVYLVDRTVPMLPERLSNQLCSLRPNEDKLTFCALFEIDEKGKIYSEWFGRTIIHSDQRFAYEQAQEAIEKGQGTLAKELQLLNQIALKLRKDRFGKGAVNFESTEVKFKLDEKGKPLAVVPKVRKDAHKLIEEFLLMANR